jgi:hypothetical protein
MPPRAPRSASTPACPPDLPPLIDPASPANMKWARAIARGVLKRAELLYGGPDEDDLIATAFLAAANYATRFDPVKAFRAGCERSILRACRRWRPGGRVPPRSGPAVIEGKCQKRWAESIASGAAARRRFSKGSTERAALLAIARATAVRRAAEYDRACAFRGWATQEVRMRCTREAARMKSGGLCVMSERAREEHPLVALPHPQRGTRGGAWEVHSDVTLSRDCRIPEPDDSDERGEPAPRFFRTRLARQLWRLLGSFDPVARSLLRDDGPRPFQGQVVEWCGCELDEEVRGRAVDDAAQKRPGLGRVDLRLSYAFGDPLNEGE